MCTLHVLSLLIYLHYTGNYTDLVSFRMDCSQSGFPDVVVTTEPPLRTEIDLELSRNAKVAFSVKCTDENNMSTVWNNSFGVSQAVHCIDQPIKIHI